MSPAFVLSLIQLLLIVIVNPSTTEGRRLSRISNVEEAEDAGSSDARRAPAADVEIPSELVSRRRWYSSRLMPWDDHDMPWLKRSGHKTDDVDRRGWGNGIPPWVRRHDSVPMSAENTRVRRLVKL